MQATVTLITTREPATGRTMCRPACELYRTLEQASRNVERREYESGIMTYLTTRRISWSAMPNIAPVGDIF